MKSVLVFNMENNDTYLKGFLEDYNKILECRVSDWGVLQVPLLNLNLGGCTPENHGLSNSKSANSPFQLKWALMDTAAFWTLASKFSPVKMRFEEFPGVLAVKDLALSLLWHGLDPRPGSFCDAKGAKKSPLSHCDTCQVFQWGKIIPPAVL